MPLADAYLGGYEAARGRIRDRKNDQFRTRQSLLEQAHRKSMLEEQRLLREQGNEQFEQMAEERLAAFNRDEVRYRQEREFYDKDGNIVGNQDITPFPKDLVDVEKIPVRLGQFAGGDSMLGAGVLNTRGGSYIPHAQGIALAQDADQFKTTEKRLGEESAANAGYRATMTNLARADALRQKTLFDQGQADRALVDRQRSLMAMANEASLFGELPSLQESPSSEREYRQTHLNSPGLFSLFSRNSRPKSFEEPETRYGVPPIVAPFAPGQQPEGMMTPAQPTDYGVQQSQNYQGIDDYLDSAMAVLRGEAPLPDGSVMTSEDRLWLSENPANLQRLFNDLGITEDILQGNTRLLNRAQLEMLNAEHGHLLKFITNDNVDALTMDQKRGLAKLLEGAAQQAQQAPVPPGQ